MKLFSYDKGKFSVYRQQPENKMISTWITEKSFLTFEKPELILKKKSRKRNKLYCFHLDELACDITMKVSEVSQDYKFWRKINVFLTSIFKDYNLNSYKSSISLYESGVTTLIPIAYWTYRKKGLNYKSYFLYENVKSELSVTELINEIKKYDCANKDLLIEKITNKHIAIIKSIHSANIRHDDPHGGNILTDIKISEVNNLKPNDLEVSVFTLIDNDRCTKTRVTISPIKLFFDLSCLTKFDSSKIPHNELIKRYLGYKYNNWWLLIFKFWNTGGFNLKKRLYYVLQIKHLYQR